METDRDATERNRLRLDGIRLHLYTHRYQEWLKCKSEGCEWVTKEVVPLPEYAEQIKKDKWPPKTEEWPFDLSDEEALKDWTRHSKRQEGYWKKTVTEDAGTVDNDASSTEGNGGAAAEGDEGAGFFMKFMIGFVKSLSIEITQMLSISLVVFVT